MPKQDEPTAELRIKLAPQLVVLDIHVYEAVGSGLSKFIALISGMTSSVDNQSLLLEIESSADI